MKYHRKCLPATNVFRDINVTTPEFVVMGIAGTSANLSLALGIAIELSPIAHDAFKGLTSAHGGRDLLHRCWI